MTLPTLGNDPVFDQMKSKYDKLNTKVCDLSELSISEQLKLMEVAKSDLTSSRTKQNIQNVFFNMISWYKKSLRENENLKSQLKQKNNMIDDLKAKQNKLNQYENYSASVMNEIKQNPIVIRIKQHENEAQNNINKDLNLKDELFKQLEDIKDQVAVKDLKIRGDRITFSTINEEQQKKIQDHLMNSDTICAHQPKKRTPALKIKEIDKSWTKEYVKECLSKECCEKNKIDIKFEINDARFKTKQMIVVLGEEDTKRFLNQGYVKMSILAHPIEPSYNIIQCHHCLKYGHYYSDKLGNVKCPNATKDPTCKFCAENHQSKNCPNKSDKSKFKCAGCKKSGHCASYWKCEKRIDVLSKIKKNYLC